MIDDRSRSSTLEPEEKGSSHFLLLSLVRTVVEKHGGSMEIDQKTNSFTVTISESQKAACFRELEKIIGPSKPLSESFSLQ